MTTIRVNQHWYNKILLPALKDWKAGSTREKVRAIVLDFLKCQREEPRKGHKEAQNLDCTPVSDRTISDLFKFVASRTKFRKWVTERSLVIKDRSWIDPSLSKQIKVECYPDSWHITEPDCPGKRHIKVEYNDQLGYTGMLKKKILDAEGTKVKTDDPICELTFRGKWAIEQYEKFMLPLADLREAARYADNSKKPGIYRHSRFYNVVSMGAKRLRGKCLIDDNSDCELQEGLDLNAAAVHGAALAAAYLFHDQNRFKGYGELGKVTDSMLTEWADGLISGTEGDFYKKIWEEVRKEDPGAYNRDFQEARKTVKLDVVCIQNYSLERLAGTEVAFLNHSRGVSVNTSARRQWMVWKAIKKFNRIAWGAILVTKLNGARDAFYQLHTFGEKAMMDTIAGVLRKRGISVHRVHDALWSTDARLIKPDMSKSDRKAYIDNICGEIFNEQVRANGSLPLGGISSMFNGIVPEETFEKVCSGLVITDEQKDILYSAMLNPDSYGEEAFPSNVNEEFWKYIPRKTQRN